MSSSQLLELGPAPMGWVVALTAAALAAMPAAITGASPAKTLFFDMEDIAESAGVGVKVHAPREREAFAMTYDEPWENVRSFGYNSVLDNSTHVLIYYGVKSAWELPDGSYQNTYFTCLAVSDDSGVTFTKPVLNLVEINGSKANNCVWPPGGVLAADHEPGTVFLDTNPKSPPDERYKMVATWGLCPGCANGTFTFVSPDGLRFRPVSRGNCSANHLGPCRPSDSLGPASGISGTQHVAFFDHRIEQYVEYRRSYVDYSKPCPWAGSQRPWPDAITCDICVGAHCGKSSPGGRKVNRCTTTDWTLFPGCEFFADSFVPGPVNANTDLVFGTDEHDPPCMDVYTNQIVVYAGHYLMFPSMYLHFPGPPAWNASSNDGTWDTRIAHSRTGENFSYMGDDATGGGRTTWLRRGTLGGPREATQDVNTASAWDSGMTAALRGYVERPGVIRMFKWGDVLRHGQCDVGSAKNSIGGCHHCGCAPRVIGRTAGIKALELRTDGWTSLSTLPVAWPTGVGMNNNGTAARGSTGDEVVALTKPISFRSVDGGSRLMLNVDVTASAQLLVEMRDEHGAAILGRTLLDCLPVSGNNLATAVQWREARAMVPESGSLRFIFRGEVHLYSFWFR